MKLKTFKKLNLRNKKVLVRVNLDVPIKNGRILDDSRIRAHLPTISYLVKKKTKIILISHLNDPFKNKKLNVKDQKYILKIKKQYSLRIVAEYLNKLNRELKIKFINDCLGEKVEKEIKKLKPGELILLENLRFYLGEQKNNRNFAKKLASLADVYINDAFAVCHRNHASVAAITDYLPSYAGLLLEIEVNNLSQVLGGPKHPFVLLVGGAKIFTKLPAIKSLVKEVDKILVGGALANNFFKAQKLNIGQSVYEKEMLGQVKRLLKNKKIILPVDVKVKSKIKNKNLPSAEPCFRQGRKLYSENKKQKTQIKNVKTEELKKIKNFKILDIGSETIKLFSKYLKSAKMIVWNGPMGYFEEKSFQLGTGKIAEEIFKNKKVRVFIGGGDTLAALQQSRINADTTRGLTRSKSAHVFISTGGGAMLDFLSGKTLPGIKPLLKNYTF